MPPMFSGESNPDRQEIPPEDSVQTQTETPATGMREAPRRRRWWLFLLAYIAVLFFVGVVAFTQGRNVNQTRRQEEISNSLQEQFDLGVQDLEAGNYQVAKQRFEAILRVDPGFPEVEDKLVQIYVVLNASTPTSTPEPTSTPDPSPPDDLLRQAKEALGQGDWDTTISKLLTLRKKDPTYQQVEVDGLMYLSLRNRGMELIEQGQMEEGLYDLSRADRFGPLDRDAQFRRTLAQTYILANSYIGLDWARAADLFAQLCAQGATLDSCPKYGEAAWQYGDLLWASEDPCGASTQYGGSLEAWPNATVAPTATKAAAVCATATAPPRRPPKATDTPSADETPAPPEETPTPEPSATPEGNEDG